MVGKRNLDIKNKIILGVDLLHRAHISIQSNGRHFAVIARMTKENGLKSRVRLQQHIWAKDIELSNESFQSNATTGMVANSRLFFSCEAQIKNKQFLGTTVTLQPLYRINWENEWPLILNSNLLQVQKIDYKTPINKTLKLHINHSLNTEKSLKRQSTSDFTS